MKKCFFPTKIWNDSLFMEMHESHKLMYIFLISNPYVSWCGVYKIPVNQISFYLGSRETPGVNLFESFLKQYPNLVKYDEETEEIAILNWPKNNFQNLTSNSKSAMKNSLKEVESELLLSAMMEAAKRSENRKIFAYRLRDLRNEKKEVLKIIAENASTPSKPLEINEVAPKPKLNQTKPKLNLKKTKEKKEINQADSTESTEEDFSDKKDLDSPSSAKKKSVTQKRASGTRQTAAAAVDKPNPSKAFATVFDEVHEELFDIKYNWALARKEFGILANIRKMIDVQLGDVSLEIKLAFFRKLLIVASEDDFILKNQFSLGGILSQYQKLVQRLSTSIEKEPDWPENYDDEMKSKYLSRKEDFKLKYKNIYKSFGYFEPSEVYILSNHTRLYPAARFHVTKRNYQHLFKKILQDLESDTFRKQKCSNLFDYVLSEIKKVILPK